MADTGWVIAGTGTTSGSNDRNWVNASNVTADDASYAQVTNLDEEQSSNLLVGHNFGLSVPSGATIDGIEIKIEWYGGSPRSTIDNIAKLRKPLEDPPGGPGGSSSSGSGNKAKLNNPSFSVQTVTYGNSTDLWGFTGEYPAEDLDSGDVNDLDFGFEFGVVEDEDDNNNEVYVDYIAVKVHYTESAGDPSPGGSDLIWPII